MIVLAVNDDHAVMDLVAHFLGIVTHHNINAAPSKKVALEIVISGDEPAEGPLQDDDAECPS